MADQLVLKVRLAWWLKPVTRVLVFLALRGLLNRNWTFLTCHKLARMAIKTDAPQVKGAA